MTAISKIIKNRIIKDNGNYLCNDNISKYIEPTEMDQLVDEVAGKMQEVLESLIIDTENDHNTKDTARRVSKMFCNEVFSGRYVSMPNVTAFPNVTKYDQVYVTGPITIRSTCAHHFQNIFGTCYIGVFPGTSVIGLSKFNRLIEWITSRPQIQEEMTQQIADLLEKMTEADGIAVLIEAEHGCMSMRGVKEHAPSMTTSVMRGKFRDTPHIKQEFFNIISTKGLK